MKSMTAMGYATGKLAGRDATLELRSVNGKRRDLTLRLPKELLLPEEQVIAAFDAAGIERGKMDLVLTLQGAPAVPAGPDKTAVAAYVTMLRELRDEFMLADDISVMKVAENKEFFYKNEPAADPDARFAEFSPLLNAVLADFKARREAEGNRLWADMREKLHYIGDCVEKAKKRAALSPQKYRAMLTARLREVLAELGQEPDEARLLTEVALFADRVAIDEELVRLSSHLVSFEEIAAGDAPGRKLDFLLQEMNREANTMGAKCQDAEIALLVVEIRCTLEKIREQVQNIE